MEAVVGETEVQGADIVVIAFVVFKAAPWNLGGRAVTRSDIAHVDRALAAVIAICGGKAAVR